MRTLVALTLLSIAALGQGLDPAKLLRLPTDAWPTYNGDYTGRRFSTLSQINQSNIKNLNLAWIYRANVGETPGAIVGGEGAAPKRGESAANPFGVSVKATPLMVNGILYFTTPDNAWAVDARFGRQLWHYQRASEGDKIGHRGLAMYKNWLYFTTSDAHLVCLDAKDGSVRWTVE